MIKTKILGASTILLLPLILWTVLGFPDPSHAIGHTYFIDISSGDRMVKTVAGRWTIRSTIDQTEFPMAVRRYSPPKEPPAWHETSESYVGGLYVDYEEGALPSLCDYVIKVPTYVSGNESDRAAVILKYATLLRARDSKAFYKELQKAFDEDFPKNMSDQ